MCLTAIASFPLGPPSHARCPSEPARGAAEHFRGGTPCSGSASPACAICARSTARAAPGNTAQRASCSGDPTAAGARARRSSGHSTAAPSRTRARHCARTHPDRARVRAAYAAWPSAIQLVRNASLGIIRRRRHAAARAANAAEHSIVIATAAYVSASSALKPVSSDANS